jgi:hypothetical protein
MVGPSHLNDFVQASIEVGNSIAELSLDYEFAAALTIAGEQTSVKGSPWD